MLLKGLALTITLLPTYAMAGTPSSVPFENQWAFENKGQEVCRFDGKNCLKGKAGVDMKAKEAWAKQNDCSATTVAILDTGADSRHPDLAGNVLPGKNFVSSADFDTAEDDNLHGTHVAGIVAGNGNETKGINGVCHKAKVIPVKVASAEGYLSDSDVLEGMQYAVAQGAKVINGSFGGGPSSEVIKEQIEKSKGTLFVFAAGNGDMFGRGFDIDQTAVYPASYDLPNIVAVAATDSQDRLGKFSNFGETRVHLAAPGVNIYSTFPSKATEEMLSNHIPTMMGAIDGTSMATPYVTGAAALLWSSMPNADVATVKAKLISSVDKVDALEGKVASGGRLSLAKLFQ